MARRRPERCKACGESLRWATTADAKPIALNAEPDPERGTVVLKKDLVGAGQIADVLGDVAAARASVRGEDVYVRHDDDVCSGKWEKGRAS